RGREQLERVVEERAHVHALLTHGERARLDPRRVEQVPDEVLHALRGALDDAETLQPLVLVERDLAQDSGAEDDGVDGVPQVVRDDGHHLVAKPARALGRLARRALGREQSLPLPLRAEPSGNAAPMSTGTRLPSASANSFSQFIATPCSFSSTSFVASTSAHSGGVSSLQLTRPARRSSSDRPSMRRNSAFAPVIAPDMLQ